MAIAHCASCAKQGKTHSQDELHGKFVRVINDFTRKGQTVERCTVCGHEKVTGTAK